VEGAKPSHQKKHFVINNSELVIPEILLRSIDILYAEIYRKLS